MLSAFGMFWTGEGLGVAWPGADLAIVAFAALFLAVGVVAVVLAVAGRVRRRYHEYSRRIFRELTGLFVEDGSLALAIPAVVVARRFCCYQKAECPNGGGAFCYLVATACFW